MTRRRMELVQPRTSARAPALRLTPSGHASGRHSNRGFTQALLEQHSEAAAARGLAPANAQFGCLLNFLFAPTPETLRPYAALAASLADPAQRATCEQITHALSHALQCAPPHELRSRLGDSV